LDDPALAGPSNNHTDTYSLDAFGEEFASATGSTHNPYRFGGAWGYITDPSGMLQLGARSYWPEIGRFIQQDPIGDGINWYAYVGSNPVVWVDPYGLEPWNDWGDFKGWYMGGMGGLSQSIDCWLLGGSTYNMGKTTGLHDAGLASSWDLLVAQGNWGGRLAFTAFTATEAPGVRLALRPNTLGVSGRVYGRFWGYADLHHAPHHGFRVLRGGTAHHAQIGANLLGTMRTLRIPYWPG
jgi:RHS repeat-associated protein